MELDQLPERLRARVTDMVVLAQDRVVEAVKAYLESQGYSQVEVVLGRKHGIDIQAVGPQGRLIGEAVGAYLTQPEDTNHFNTVLGQILRRMSDPDAQYVITLPDSPTYRKLVQKLPPLAWQRLGLTVMFVRHDDSGYHVMEERLTEAASD